MDNTENTKEPLPLTQENMKFMSDKEILDIVTQQLAGRGILFTRAYEEAKKWAENLEDRWIE